MSHSIKMPTSDVTQQSLCKHNTGAGRGAIKAPQTFRCGELKGLFFQYFHTSADADPDMKGINGG